MANVVTVRTLTDGVTLTDLEITGILDTADLSGFTVADPATFEYIDILTKTKASGFGVVAIQYYSIQDGLDVELYFDATTPDYFGVLSGRGKILYYKEGYRRCMNAAPTGLIKMNTIGVVPGGVFAFTIKLELRKRN